MRNETRARYAPGSVREHIAGPVRGYYIALYAHQSSDGCAAYFKICCQQPPSYWEAACLFKGCGAALAPDLERAMLMAQAVACEALGNLPPAQRPRA
ncbi:hypothetical protein [Ramlibacter alkalitolerans]|uniref:Uncharacterized protein n=1 Tax=Ramlibacter alkalitolerans TaxID=2039631 RepID=A0ABS1JKV6_9BURK|nr:hypothetical protein [Ramlibacter alkalitolerans]MBL0424849.1 hypothetical protein [Ramlibacter alkalitolerans]